MQESNNKWRDNCNESMQDYYKARTCSGLCISISIAGKAPAKHYLDVLPYLKTHRPMTISISKLYVLSSNLWHE